MESDEEQSVVQSGFDHLEEKEKATATQNQLRIWDTLLEVRIRIQKMLSESNQLPQLEGFETLLNSDKGKDHKLQSTRDKTVAALQEFLSNLLELQDVMIKNSPETNAGVNKKRKVDGKDEEDEEIPSDDEVIKEEDENGLESEEEDSLPEEEMKVTSTLHHSQSPSKRKKLRVESYDKMITQEFQKFSFYRDETIQKWNDKTQLSFGKYRNKSSGPQIPTLKQISHILADKQRLIKRTQTKRTAYQVIGKPLLEEGSEEDAGQDPEIFDDDDFYHQLLRELIDRKTANIKDPVELGRQWLELQKMRTKLKRKVDTDASKGRKIRYDVHPKLVNFMAPVDNCPMSESAVNELMNSLFGKLST